MQSTLVAFYRRKPKILSDFIKHVQDELKTGLNHYFLPYTIDQVHATIIGMEGHITDGKVTNSSFEDLRGEKRAMKFEEALEFMRTTNLLPINIRIGGFRRDQHYSFTSQGMHPFYRSFSINQNSVVVMGWPYVGEEYTSTMHVLRSEFQQYNMLHRYFKTSTHIDNDFYFVLGKIKSGIDQLILQEVENRMRLSLEKVSPLSMPLTHDEISIVFYREKSLPTSTSISYPLSNLTLDEFSITKKYEEKE